jgi:hypothetical protein
MDDQTFLEVLLFANLQPGEMKRKLLLNPNMNQGIDVTTQNGEVLYSFQPGVSTEGAALMQDGEKIASIRDGVHGTTVIDYGLGETAVSYPDLFGSKIIDHGDGVIGFTRPAFDGGMELQNQFHKPIASLENGEMLVEKNENAFDFSTSIPGNSFGSSAELYEATDVADDAMDLFDAASVLGDLF